MCRFPFLVLLLAACPKNDKEGGLDRLAGTKPNPTAPKEPGSTYGGNGEPARWDDNGHPHGPGGPVFMGRGPQCSAERDHCMRPGVYFGVDNLVPGKLYRATPIYELDSKWYNWRGTEEKFEKKFKTKVGTKETVQVGQPIIWFIEEGTSKRFVDVEYESLTSSRWEVGYVEALTNDKVRVKGWTDGPVTYDTIRVIVDMK